MNFSLPTLSVVVSVIVIMLSYYYKRSRPLFIAILFLFWQYPYTSSNLLSMPEFHVSLSILVPLTFLSIGVSPDKGIHSRDGLIKLFVLLCLLGASYFIAQNPLIANHLLERYINFNIPYLKPTTQIGLLLSLIALVAIFVRMIFEKTPYMKMLPFAYMLSVAPFLFYFKTSYTPLFLAGSLFIIGIALFMQTYDMAYKDPLTQIPSRLAMNEYVKSLTPPYSLCMADVDFFKKFNDTYGHKVGDEVLKFIATELKATKGGAKAFRYGGEEFCILFSKKNAYEVRHYLETTRERIAQKGFVIRSDGRSEKTNTRRRNITSNKQNGNKHVKLTISMGVADSEDEKDISKLFVLADQALYKAKSDGRNCVRLFRNK